MTTCVITAFTVFAERAEQKPFQHRVDIKPIQREWSVHTWLKVIEEWLAIFALADAKHHYMGNAMLLALVTGQRLGDIANMKFADIWDDHLHIVHEETGTRLAIPLSLRCNAIGWSLEPGAWSLEPGAWSLEPGAWSLEEIVKCCRDYVVSPYLVHFFHTTFQAKAVMVSRRARLPCVLVRLGTKPG